MMKPAALPLLLLTPSLLFAPSARSAPEEPVEIGGRVQFFLDDHMVDNRWSLKPKTEEVLRVFHAPVKHEANPVVSGEGGYVTSALDPETGLIRIWYQVAAYTGGKGADYAIAYAESNDGIRFERPVLNRVEWLGTKENNIVWRGPTGQRASGAQVLQVPEKDRRGFRYLLCYRTSGSGKDQNGIRVVGSENGIDWDLESDSLIADLHSDTINSIVYDTDRSEYVMFCRPKDRYLFAGAGDFLETGESRRVARMSGSDLWTPWEGSPRTILIPDELGADEAWDRGMVYGSMDWIEKGDQWYFYYAGHDGPHESRDRTPGIGLATLRKNGFLSMRGPRGGGVVATRSLRWPGGDLILNADVGEGELKVRVHQPDRRAFFPGFDFSDGDPVTGDSVAHVVRWKGRSLGELKGEIVRLEFYLREADLFTFQAGE